MVILRIGAVDIPVEMTDLSDSLGEYQADPVPKIKIQHGLEEPVRSLTMLHEVMHAISDQYSLDLSENTVRRLETALGQACRDNPGVFLAVITAFWDNIEDVLDAHDAIQALYNHKDT